MTIKLCVFYSRPQNPTKVSYNNEEEHYLQVFYSLFYLSLIFEFRNLSKFWKCFF